MRSGQPTRVISARVNRKFELFWSIFQLITQDQRLGQLPRNLNANILVPVLTYHGSVDPRCGRQGTELDWWSGPYNHLYSRAAQCSIQPRFPRAGTMRNMYPMCGVARVAPGPPAPSGLACSPPNWVWCGCASDGVSTRPRKFERVCLLGLEGAGERAPPDRARTQRAQHVPTWPPWFPGPWGLVPVTQHPMGPNTTPL